MQGRLHCLKCQWEQHCFPSIASVGVITVLPDKPVRHSAISLWRSIRMTSWLLSINIYIPQLQLMQAQDHRPASRLLS